MATVTRTTVEVVVRQYRYRAELDGNAIELYRDGVSAGSATWNGGRIEGQGLVHVDENGHGADTKDAFEAGYEGKNGHDHFVTGADAKSRERCRQGGGAAAYELGVVAMCDLADGSLQFFCLPDAFAGTVEAITHHDTGVEDVVYFFSFFGAE